MAFRSSDPDTRRLKKIWQCFFKVTFKKILNILICGNNEDFEED